MGYRTAPFGCIAPQVVRTYQPIRCHSNELYLTLVLSMGQRPGFPKPELELKIQRAQQAAQSPNQDDGISQLYWWKPEF